MGIKVKTDLEWGQAFYLKTDPEQFKHLLVGVTLLPGNQLKFMLSYQGDVSTVFDFECTAEPDYPPSLKLDTDEEE